MLKNHKKDIVKETLIAQIFFKAEAFKNEGPQTEESIQTFKPATLMAVRFRQHAKTKSHKLKKNNTENRSNCNFKLHQ